MVKGIAVFACAVCCGVLDGCATTAPPSPRADPVGAADYPKVAVVEPALARALAIDQGRIQETPSDGSHPMSVTVPVRSLADNHMAIQYRYIWMDGKGTVRHEETWTFLHMEPKLQKMIHSNALDLQSSDWRLEIRSSQ